MNLVKLPARGPTPGVLHPPQTKVGGSVAGFSLFFGGLLWHWWGTQERRDATKGCRAHEFRVMAVPAAHIKTSQKLDNRPGMWGSAGHIRVAKDAKKLTTSTIMQRIARREQGNTDVQANTFAVTGDVLSSGITDAADSTELPGRVKLCVMPASKNVVELLAPTPPEGEGGSAMARLVMSPSGATYTVPTTRSTSYEALLAAARAAGAALRDDIGVVELHHEACSPEEMLDMTVREAALFAERKVARDKKKKKEMEQLAQRLVEMEEEEERARSSAMYKMQEQVAAARRRERAEAKKAGGLADKVKAKEELEKELDVLAQREAALAQREAGPDGVAELDEIHRHRVEVLRKQRML